MTAAEQSMSSGKGHRLNSVDAHVGTRIRVRRTLLGMSQAGLGTAIGVTSYSIQDYEAGSSRIGASRLYYLSRAMRVPINFFFDDTPGALAAPSDHMSRLLVSESPSSFGDDTLVSRETIELVGAYYRISDPSVRKNVMNLITAMGPPEA